MKTMVFPTSHKTQLMDITKEVTEAVITSGVKEGICVIFTPHTTASVFYFENRDPKLRRDLLGELRKCAPADGTYEHDGDNAAAHLKSALTGANITLPVSGGRPLFGQWQGVFFGEYDGPRQERKVIIKVIAE